MKAEKNRFQMLAEKIQAPDSRYIPQLFGMLVTDQEAEILLALPATDKELVERFKMKPSEMEEKLSDFFIKGLVLKVNTPEGIQYRFIRDVLQFHDSTNIWTGASPAYHELWERFIEEEWPAQTKVMDNSMTRPFFRVIPVEKTIAVRSQILAFESCKDIIDMNDSLAVANCPCRIRSRKCDRPLETCLQIGKAADYALERGTGRQVSKKEAMQILRQTEEAGLVHVTLNKADGMYFICNCCGCCCIALRSLVQYGRIVTDPSRFLAEVDEDTCTACGACEESCYFDAIQVQEKEGHELACVDAEKCMGCGLCRVDCPEEAISLLEVREKEFIPIKFVPKASG
jgi:Pyruvate/2-oxoacid:ferredoxin oxidoreductase delta subunit